MKEFTYTIVDPVGMHARPAGLLAKEAAKYQSIVTVVKGEKKADTRRLMALMGLGIKQGETIAVRVEGPDEDTAAPAVEKYLTENHY
jgi:phosphocarrier protein HPr